LSDIEINDDKILNKILNLTVGKAPGDDGLTPQFLKEILSLIGKPLKCIFDSFIETGVVPSDWKTANVLPIFKRGQSNLSVILGQ
jgi:hypothetical protein